MVELIMHSLATRPTVMCALSGDMQKKCADVIWMHEVMQALGR
jgi:hypothetical protein